MVNSVKITIPKEIKIQLQMGEYIDRAIDYYIFSRRAVMLGVVPVGGTLFHVAVEMLMLCGLSTKYSQDELKSKFSKHELPYIWSEFKKIFGDTDLRKLDKFINHHRQWKELRYPGRKGKSSTIFFGRKKPDPEIMKKNMEYNKADILIEINLEEMDEFITTVVKAIGINPDHIKIHLQRNKELIELYLTENSFPLFKTDSMVNSANLLKG